MFRCVKNFSFAITSVLVFVSFSPRAQASVGAATPKAPVHIFYADPVNGSMNGDGSIARPWKSLQEIWDANLINGQDLTSGAVHAGDLIYLLTGNHGSLFFSASLSFANTDFITIQAAPGNHPVLNSLSVVNGSKWIFRGITFQPPATFASRPNLVTVAASDNIVIDSNTLYSLPSVLNWTPEDWNTSSVVHAISFNGVTNSTISRNSIKNVETGIVITGDSLLVYYNKVDYFSSDGIDFTSSNSVISNNLITNHYGQRNNGAHADGIQGWMAATDSFATNVVIDSNTVLASTGIYPAIPAVPTGLGSDLMQGISIFDGVWSNVTVTNNVASACAYHGMSFYGIADSVIDNNTVIQQGPYTTWLGVFDRVDGTHSSNVIVRNNISNAFNLSQNGVVFDHNLSFVKESISWESNIPVVDPLKVFVKYDLTHAAFNFRLLTGSPAIGMGSALGAPKYDILKYTRNPLKMDIGAYAYQGP